MHLEAVLAVVRQFQAHVAHERTPEWTREADRAPVRLREAETPLRFGRGVRCLDCPVNPAEPYCGCLNLSARVGARKS
eukprot:233368-Alexandrium_andersonii.AAC.1